MHESCIHATFRRRAQSNPGRRSVALNTEGRRHDHHHAPLRVHHRRRTRGRRGRLHRRDQRRLDQSARCRHRPAGAAGAGRLGAAQEGPQARGRARRHHHRRHPGPRSRVPARRRIPRGVRRRLRQMGGRGLRRAGLLRLARRVRPRGPPRRQAAAPGRVPDVHAERLDRPPRRGAHRRGDLAGVHRHARRDLHEQAVPVAAARGLHARVRHQLGRAVPRDGGDARDPGVHLGRDLPGPRGGALPASSSTRPPRSPSSTSRSRTARCSPTRASRRRLS